MPLISRRQLIAASLALPSAALAQGVPSNSHLIVGSAPGSPTDTITRLFADQLRRMRFPSLRVENRLGAGGRFAAEAVMMAAPDASEILIAPGSALTIHPHTHHQVLRCDALADFVPLTPLCCTPFALMVADEHPARDFAEFRTWARRLREPLRYVSPAAGSAPHFLGLALGREIGVIMEHIAHGSPASALQNALVGSPLAAVCVLDGERDLHPASRVRILAVTSAQRLSRLPAVPTFAELGDPGMTGEDWLGMLVPRGTPAGITETLHEAVTMAAGSPELREGLRELGYRPLIEPRARFARRIAADLQRWAPIVAASSFVADD